MKKVLKIVEKSKKKLEEKKVEKKLKKNLRRKNWKIVENLWNKNELLPITPLKKKMRFF